MDKLQWFKFTPSEWMMGKIQRCPELTQARFLRLICLYWNKECVLTFEDAEIEIDKEHLDILVSKKIIVISDKNINISFLDEQNLEIQESTKDKSKSGIVGNLKRWHPLLHNRFINKEISLEKAVELSKIIAEQSHTDGEPIAEQSQSIADKNREDEEEKRLREEEIRKELLLKKEAKFNFKKYLLIYGFDENLIDDWIKVRKTKKATNTETAYNSFISEIEKRDCNINEMLQICVTQSWSGFKHSWVDNLNKIENGSKNNNSHGSDAEHKQSAIEAVNKLFGIQ